MPQELAALPSRRALLDRIETLDIPADAKLLLARLLTTTLEVGGRIVEVGRRILAFALDLARTFPNTIFGVTVALIMSMLIASVPLLGGLLAPLLTPLLLALGLGMGALADLRQGEVGRRIELLATELRALVA